MTGWSTGGRKPDWREYAARGEARDRAQGTCRDCGMPVVWVTCIRDDFTTYKRPMHPTPSVDGTWFLTSGNNAMCASREWSQQADPGKYVDHRDICAGKDAS